MIELTWLQMAHPKFQEATLAIFDCPMLDGHTSYTASRIYQAIEKANVEIKHMRMAMLSKYGKKDENGKLVSNEQGHIEFEKDEHHKAFEEEFMKEFQAKKVTIKVTKLDFQKLASVKGITPMMWEFIIPIVDNLPVEEDSSLPQ